MPGRTPAISEETPNQRREDPAINLIMAILADASTNTVFLKCQVLGQNRLTFVSSGVYPAYSTWQYGQKLRPLDGGKLHQQDFSNRMCSTEKYRY